MNAILNIASIIGILLSNSLLLILLIFTITYINILIEVFYILIILLGFRYSASSLPSISSAGVAIGVIIVLSICYFELRWFQSFH